MKLALLLALAINLLTISTSVGQTSLQVDEINSITENLDIYMDRMVEKGFSGGVLISLNGDVIAASGYGSADMANNHPFTPTTVFPIGSITKQFTGAAILKLEEMGKVNVSDPLSNYFEDVPSDKQAVTVHHLLTHSSGLPGWIGEDFDVIDRDSYVEKALNTPLLFQPGTGYEYSNVGYSLLAAIIEQESGESYDSFAQQYLFSPAGMEKTGYDFSRFEGDVIAHGYRDGEDWGSFADHSWGVDGPYWNLRGNGGLMSTLGDLHLWHRALLDDTVLSDSSRKKYFTPHQPERPGASSYYGYGWVIEDTQAGRVIHHNGGNPHFSSDMRRYMDHDALIVVTANTAEQRAFPVMDAVEQILFGMPVRLPPLVEKELTMEELPNHMAGPVVLALLDMLKGDPEDVLPFVRNHMSDRLLQRYSAEDLASNFAQDQEYLGAVEIRSIVEASPTELQLVVKPEADTEWRLLTVTVEEGSPHKIIGLGVDDVP